MARPKTRGRTVLEELVRIVAHDDHGRAKRDSRAKGVIEGSAIGLKLLVHSRGGSISDHEVDYIATHKDERTLLGAIGDKGWGRDNPNEVLRHHGLQRSNVNL